MATKFSINVTAADSESPKVSTADLAAANLRNWFHKRAGKNHQGQDTVAIRTAMTAASGTVTVGTSVDDNDTVTIGGIAFTAKAAGPTGDQWLIDADASVCAAALAAAINASTTAGVAGCVTASASGAVVTITAAQPGKIGNAITLASSDGTDLVVSGARLSGGAETLSTYTF
jgi:phage tail sheath gpL-like